MNKEKSAALHLANVQKLIAKSEQLGYHETYGTICPPLRNMPKTLALALEEIIQLRQACYNAYCIISHAVDNPSVEKTLDNLLAASEGEAFTSEDWNFEFK